MNRKQRIRSCGNLLQIMETTRSAKLREACRLQYRSMASRIKMKKALDGVGAVQG
ncbi:hypothetical protein HGI30_16875 [Paenibacillus albicereus]|uniref:Uncharacterized protein n=1 Tax=Paenibacillus albicereus TaxID=2726185 RepID=A0A6H2H069_9BACL|nr:hypothetical protein [Paenibacillus albicereus]QJC53083.1 hypothetical protein HGI30_16875 [Paenibacillus albicereus]